VNFFVVTIIDIHQMNLGPFGHLNFLVENSYVFFSFFSIIKAKYFMCLKKKPIENERERDFIVAHCIIFSNFFCLVMSYELET